MKFETLKDNVTGRIVSVHLESRSFTDEQILTALNQFLAEDDGRLIVETSDETVTWIGNNTVDEVEQP